MQDKLLRSQPQVPEFRRYQIPPNFDYCKIHAEACLITDPNHGQSVNQCPCCERSVGSKKMALCSDIQQLTKIGEQIPLFFYFLRSLILFVGIFIFGKLIDQVVCNCDIINVELQIPSTSNTIYFPVGYLQKNRFAGTVQFLILAFMILLLKICLKRKKYQIKAMGKMVSKRTLMLQNLPTDSTENEIIQCLFQGYQVKQVVFTYRFRVVHQCLSQMQKLKKYAILASQDRNKSKSQIDVEGQILQQLKEYQQKLKIIKQKFTESSNRLDIAFVTFENEQDRNGALKKLETGYIMGKIYGICVCCSKSQLKYQHIDVTFAPEPEDVNWNELETPFFESTIRTLFSNIICTILLIFGLGSEYIISELLSSKGTQKTDLISTIIKTVAVFITNFVIITFIEYNTKKAESYRTKTSRNLYLTVKLSVFIFLNLSMPPLFLFIIKRVTEDSQKGSWETLGFTIVMVQFSNIFKPFMTYFSVGRLAKFMRSTKQERKKENCKLTQLQANHLLEPIEFPIALYYALTFSSLLLVFFFLSIFQSLILLQFLGLIMMLTISKWMLIRVCKQPLGLSLNLHNLAQMVLRLTVPVYWLGRNICYFFEQTEESFFQYIIYGQWQSFVEIGVMILMTVFSEPLVKFAVKYLIKKPQLTQEEHQFLVNRFSDRADYRASNLAFRLEKELQNY